MYDEVVSCSSRLHTEQGTPGVLNFTRFTRILQVRVDIKGLSTLQSLNSWIHTFNCSLVHFSSGYK